MTSSSGAMERAKIPPELPINGTTDETFFLASLASPVPNLNAFPLNRTDVTVKYVRCLYSKSILEQCEAGKRKKELTAIQKLMKKYNI